MRAGCACAIAAVDATMKAIAAGIVLLAVIVLVFIWPSLAAHRNWKVTRTGFSPVQLDCGPIQCPSRAALAKSLACPLLALSGHSTDTLECLLSGTKLTGARGRMHVFQYADSFVLWEEPHHFAKS
jgi:hypothetical protein